MNGIWIRTQDRSLHFCKSFHVNKQSVFNHDKPYAVIGIVVSQFDPYLGWYATEERALQVLDAIQQAIVDLKVHEMYPPDIKDGAYWTKVFTVYQMPAE